MVGCVLSSGASTTDLGLLGLLGLLQRKYDRPGVIRLIRVITAQVRQTLKLKSHIFWRSYDRAWGYIRVIRVITVIRVVSDFWFDVSYLVAQVRQTRP